MQTPTELKGMSFFFIGSKKVLWVRVRVVEGWRRRWPGGDPAELDQHYQVYQDVSYYIIADGLLTLTVISLSG